MKTTDGFTLRKSQVSWSYPYEVHKYLLDECNIQGNPEQGLWDREDVGTFKTRKKAEAYIKRHKDSCDKFELWDEWYECELNEYGEAVEGDKISQSVYEYKNGKCVGRDSLL